MIPAHRPLAYRPLAAGVASSSTSVTAALSATEAPDVAAFSGTTLTRGALAASEAPDVAAFSVTTLTRGALAGTEAPDVAAFQGSTFAASFTITEAPDLASFTGDMPAATVRRVTGGGAFLDGYVRPGVPAPGQYDYGRRARAPRLTTLAEEYAELRTRTPGGRG
jgi:hypothetical protein